MLNSVCVSAWMLAHKKALGKSGKALRRKVLPLRAIRPWNGLSLGPSLDYVLIQVKFPWAGSKARSATDKEADRQMRKTNTHKAQIGVLVTSE